MLRRLIQAAVCALGLAGPAQAFEECRFAFEIDTQGTAFQALVDGAAARGGFWRPIREAPDDVQAIARFVGRLDICLRTPDGLPGTVTVGGQGVTLASPHVTSCTAALLPGNRLLTNHHCFYDPQLRAAGFTLVDQARIHFGYVEKDFTGDVTTFLVANRELAVDEATDALVLQVLGGDANAALGGHLPMRMETRATPRRALTMIHHPRGDPQQFSAGTCQVHPRQADLPDTASQLRHACETAGGSSGALLLDARSLSVVGLHNQGGLDRRAGFNSGHKIAAVEAALGLGFAVPEPPAPPAPPEPDRAARAQAALAEALLIEDDAAQRAALDRIGRDFPGTRAAQSAARAAARLTPRAPGPETLASDMLVRALAIPDDAVRRVALDALIRTHPGTAAAASARGALDLMARPSATPVPQPAPAEPAEPDQQVLTLGMVLGNLTTARRADYGLESWLQGAVVLSVDPGSAAEAAGIVPGTVISGAGYASRITSPHSVSGSVDQVRAQGRQSIVLTLQEGRRKTAISLPVGADPIAVARPGSDRLSVRQDGAGDFRTLAEAVAAAPVGAVIEIGPGRYETTLDIGKPLSLIGKGPPGTVRLVSDSGRVLTWQADSGTVENLDLQTTRANTPTVEIKRGSVLFRGNVIGGAGTAVVSSGYAPRQLVFEKNTITGSGGNGLLLMGRTLQAELVGNVITGHQVHGVNLYDRSRATIRGNTITGNRGAGINLGKGGTANVTGNDLRGNRKGAFDLSSAPGSLVERDNRK